jgi:hypothetical protein
VDRTSQAGPSIEPVIERVHFLHGRIGNPGCMQVDVCRNVRRRSGCIGVGTDHPAISCLLREIARRMLPGLNLPAEFSLMRCIIWSTEQSECFCKYKMGLSKRAIHLYGLL